MAAPLVTTPDIEAGNRVTRIESGHKQGNSIGTGATGWMTDSETNKGVFMKFSRFLLASATAILPVTVNAQVVQHGAEQAPPQTYDDEIEGITVTATRRSSSLQTTPVTVSALSGDDLAKLGIARVDQVAANIPNFYMQPGIANSSTVSLSMRGRGDNAGGFGTTEQPVSF